MKLVTGFCPFCSQPFVLQVPLEGYNRWQQGELVQSAFPSLDADTRERLITGICGKCWDDMMKEPS